MKIILHNFFTAFLFASLFCSCQSRSVLKEGDKAPDFSAPDETGQIRSLQDYKGKKLVLYFYPKDDTPDCTKEACAFSDGIEDFKKQGIEVVGISADSVERHQRFKEKHHLLFTLLSDPTKEIIKAYGAKGFFWTKRITYLINEEQVIVKIYPDVEPASHARDILAFFAK